MDPRISAPANEPIKQRAQTLLQQAASLVIGHNIQVAYTSDTVCFTYNEKTLTLPQFLPPRRRDRFLPHAVITTIPLSKDRTRILLLDTSHPYILVQTHDENHNVTEKWAFLDQPLLDPANLSSLPSAPPWLPFPQQEAKLNDTPHIEIRDYDDAVAFSALSVAQRLTAKIRIHPKTPEAVRRKLSHWWHQAEKFFLRMFIQEPVNLFNPFILAWRGLYVRLFPDLSSLSQINPDFAQEVMRFFSTPNQRTPSILLACGGKIHQDAQGKKHYLLIKPCRKSLPALASLIPLAEWLPRKRATSAALMLRQVVPLSQAQQPLVFTGEEQDIPLEQWWIARNLTPPQFSMSPAFGINVLTAYFPYHGYTFEDGIVARKDLAWSAVIPVLRSTEIAIPFGKAEKGKVKYPKQYDIHHVSVNDALNPDDVIFSFTYLENGNRVKRETRWTEPFCARLITLHTDPDTETTDFIAYARAPLEIGDKMTNRYGHKGVVTALLNESELPKLPGSLLCPGLIANPFSISNRANYPMLLAAHLGMSAAVLGVRLIVPSTIDTEKDLITRAEQLGAITWGVMSHDAIAGKLALLFSHHRIRSTESDRCRLRHVDASVQKLRALLRDSAIDEKQWLRLNELLSAIAKDPACWIDALSDPIVKTYQEIILSHWKKHQQTHPWYSASDMPGSMRWRLQLPDGRMTVFPVFIGMDYWVRLEHIAALKANTHRSGRVNSVTLQPIGGRKHKGAQRIGEMEMWGLQSYGSYHLLHGLFVRQSDFPVYVASEETFMPAGVFALSEYLKAIGISMRLGGTSDR